MCYEGQPVADWLPFFLFSRVKFQLNDFSSLNRELFHKAKYFNLLHHVTKCFNFESIPLDGLMSDFSI
ncbi:hypothetical protein CWO14_03550 [Vibrio splendidus]|nr:hypothetical protein A150_07070 [Vibrio splendidus 1S-124]PTQ21277.1 hypothetical protein CWO14_03550 [Vibrio splendidus]